MEWNRGASPSQPANQPASPVGAVKKTKASLKSLRVATVGLIFCIAILIVALAAYASFGGNGSSESKYVAKDRMQAVFLNGGQVYFGNITNLNDKYIRISNIYYLRVNQTVQPNGNTSQNQDISLVKLGCELHGPDDQMVVNQSQVIFWENLKSDGQVAKAVATYKQQNPNGQNCSTANSSNSSNSTGNSSTSNSSSTTSNTTDTTKKQ